MKLSNEPFIPTYPTFPLNNSLPSLCSLRFAEQFIAYLTLNHQMSTKILNLWDHALNVCHQAGRIKIFTTQPSCTYYFGPFSGV